MAAHPLTAEASTVADLLVRKARTAPNRIAATLVTDGGGGDDITYGELDRRARRLAALLGGRGAMGERVLIVHAPGIEYFAAFWGILYAGAVPVPVYPPDPRRPRPGLERIEAVAADSSARFVLTSNAFEGAREWVVSQAPRLRELDWLSSDGASQSGPEREAVRSTVPALIQYTSGSTGTPKGVVVEHRNVLANLELIHEIVGETEDGCSVLWLPPYHDMGLLNQIYSVAVGMRVVLLAPQHFLARPALWLETITKYRGTYSGGPNFGYDLVTRKIDPAARAALDLSSWRTAFNGAEPVRAETLARFADAFGPCGFSAGSFLPCYGLAESTVAVAGKMTGAPVVSEFDAAALAEGRAAANGTGRHGELGTRLVSCGRTTPAHRIRIVDPERRVVLNDGLVGEIWFSGPSVAAGYWDKPDESTRTFRATLASGDGPYLRTGDLGFLHEQELYVAGRLKDLIIVRGRNHYPQDVERTAERADPALRAGCGAAFTVDGGGSEQIVVVHEVNTQPSFDAEGVIANIRRSVATVHDLRLHAVILIPARALPKTSSGKVQRQACRAAYLSGALEPVASWTVAPIMESNAPSGEHANAAPASHLEAGGGSGAPPSDIEHWLVRRLSALGGIPAADVEAEDPIANQGLDSLGTVELLEDLSLWLGRPVPVEFVWSNPSIREVVRKVTRSEPNTASARDATCFPVKAAAPEGFSFYQRYDKDEYRTRTNRHYELPARFFEVLTGGHWHTYSGNVWEGIPNPTPDDEAHQTESQAKKLDQFAELLELRPGMRVLDVGAGWGGPLVYLCKKYGVRGHGVALSRDQVDYARAFVAREGVDCTIELKDWQDLTADGSFDGIFTDEVIVHFFHLDAFFQKAFGLLRDGGIIVNKELHFAHAAYAREPDAAMRFIGNLYGNVCSYRTLADELMLAGNAGFRVEDIRQIAPENYYLTAASWHANLRRHEEELVALVGAEVYSSYLKYLLYVMLSPGGKTTEPLPLYTHYVKCRKPPRGMRAKLGPASSAAE